MLNADASTWLNTGDADCQDERRFFYGKATDLYKEYLRRYSKATNLYKEYLRMYSKEKD